MSNHTCSLRSAGESINFLSDVDLYSPFSAESFVREHIDIEVVRDLLPTPFQVHYTNGSAETLVYLDTEMHLCYPWEKLCDGHTLIYVASPLIELQRQLNGYVTAHSAAVDIGGNSILLLGKIGAGKTSIAIDLCQRYGAALIGNDITVIGLKYGDICLKGGTKFFFLRYESVKRNLPNLLRFFPKDPIETWLCKTKILPGDIGAGVKTGESVVGKIYLVHVDEGMSSVFVKKDSSLVTKLFLNENFSRYIRGTCLAMLGGANLDFMGYIPSFDRSELYEFRKRLIAAVMSRIVYISGPIHQVTDYIAEK